MLKNIALLFGVIFVAVGAFGFVPSLAPGGLILGYFEVNILHSIVHLLSGAVAIYAGIQGSSASKLFFQVFGVIYGLVAVLGFFYGHGQILGVLANNPADTGLHTVIAIVSLYLGFVYKESISLESGK